MSTETTKEEVAAPSYDRKKFVELWAKILKCKPTPFDVAAELVNQNRNFNSAVAVLFGLGYRDPTIAAWLGRCHKHWKAAWDKYPAGTKCSADFAYKFQQYYIKEVDKYPG